MKTASESRKMEIMVGSERGSYINIGDWEKMKTASESRKMEIMVGSERGSYISTLGTGKR